MHLKPLVLTLLMITSALAGCLESSDVDDTEITDSTIDGLDTSADLIVIDDSEKVTPPPTGKETGCWVRLYTHVSGSTSIPVDTWYDPCPVELPRSTSLERGGCYVVTADEDKDGNIKYGTVRWLEPCPYWTISDDDREITQEDCERRNGTWTETSNGEGEFYCDFGDNDAPCDENMACGEAITCIDGFYYPTTCGDRNCDEPIGRCGTYASIIIVQSAWNGAHPNYSGLNDIFNSTQPIEIFGYLDQNSGGGEATDEDARNFAEQFGINFSFTPLVGNEHGINASDIEALPYYAVYFSVSCDNIIKNQIYDDFNASYNAVIDFIDTWIDCTRSNGSENSQETES